MCPGESFKFRQQIMYSTKRHWSAAEECTCEFGKDRDYEAKRLERKEGGVNTEDNEKYTLRNASLHQRTLLLNEQKEEKRREKGEKCPKKLA